MFEWVKVPFHHGYIAIIPPFSIAFEESQAGLAELVGTGLLTFLGCGRGLRAWGSLFWGNHPSMGCWRRCVWWSLVLQPELLYCFFWLPHHLEHYGQPEFSILKIAVGLNHIKSIWGKPIDFSRKGTWDASGDLQTKRPSMKRNNINAFVSNLKRVFDLQCSSIFG